jgi:hypothetical protein
LLSVSRYNDAAAPLRTRLENILLTWREAELSVLIGKRFEVDVADSGVDMAALERCLGQVDLARLESMRNQGATTP